MTIQQSDLELIEHLDFEESIECGAGRCTNDAEWHTNLSCCGADCYFCTTCKDVVTNWIGKASFTHIYNNGCGKKTTNPYGEWVRI